MKELKKGFFSACPARCVFTALTLLLVMLWICPAVYLLCGGPHRIKLSLFLWILIPVLTVFFCLWLIAFIRFHRGVIQNLKPAWNSPGVLVCCGFMIAALGCAPKLSEIGIGYGFCGLLVIAVWAVPAVSLWKHWKLWLARGLCWTGAFFCLDHFLKCLQHSCYRIRPGVLESIIGKTSCQTILHTNYSPVPDIVIAFLGVILLPAGWFLSGKLYAAAASIRLREIFGPAVKILLGLWAVVYLISFYLAAAQSRAADRTAAERGEFFGYPLNAQGMTRLLKEQGWSDEMFRKDFPKGNMLSIPPHWKELRDISVILPADWRENFQSFLLRSASLQELEQYFDQPIRPGFPPLRDGELTAVGGNPHFDFLLFCCCEWRKIVLLLEQDRPLEALKVRHRLENALKYWRCSPLHLSSFGYNIMMKYRISAMELLLSNDRVSTAELEHWNKCLKQEEKSLEEDEFKTIYVEAAVINDYFFQLAHGHYTMPLYPLRWLYPPLWYFGAQDRRLSLDRFRCRRYRDFPVQRAERQNGSGFIFGRIGNPVFMMIRTIDELTAKYRAMQALIEIELKKRCIGKYPDSLKSPPVDPFNGKPMFYKKGKLPLIVRVWNPKLQRFTAEKREVSGVAVWSVGPDKVNDGGRERPTARETTYDITAAVIFEKR